MSLAQSTWYSDLAPHHHANLQQIKQWQEFGTPVKKSASAVVCPLSALNSAQQKNKHRASLGSKSMPDCSVLLVSTSEGIKLVDPNLFLHHVSFHRMSSQFEDCPTQKMHAT